MSRKNTRMIRKIIYRLKRDYGFAITFFKFTNLELDLETGKKRRNLYYKKIARAVLLPAKTFWKVLPETKGFIELKDRIILIDWQDVHDFNISKNDYLVYDNKQFQIIDFELYDDRTAYILKIRELKGTEVQDLALIPTATSTITLTQDVSGTVS